MNTKLGWAAFAGAVAAAGIIAATAPSFAQPPQAKMPAMPVVVGAVTESEVQGRVWHSGNLQSRNEATMASESDGNIVAIAEVGMHFDAGGVMVQLDDTLLKHTLDEHLAEIKNHKARIGFLTRELGRLAQLVKQKNISVNEFEQAQSGLDSARAMLKAATARAGLLQEKIRRMQIKAPFDGVVRTRHASKGEWVKAGDPVVELVGLQPLEIVVRVPANELRFVRHGGVLEVRSDAAQARNHALTQAIVRAVVPVGDEQSRLFELRLDPQGNVGLPGQLVRVAVPVSPLQNKLTVPEDALVIRGDGISVFRVDDSMVAQRVPVRAGASYGGRVEVNGSLQPGDKVVIRGGERLRNGMPVRLAQPRKDR